MLGRIRALGKFGMGETVVYVSCPVVSRNLHGVPLGGGGKQANNWDTFLGKVPRRAPCSPSGQPAEASLLWGERGTWLHCFAPSRIRL